MAAFARRDRAALADLLVAVGPDAPTLCGDWSTYDLAAHLVLRESNPLLAAGIAVPALERVTDAGMQWTKARRGYLDLVGALRDGPPRYSPLRLGKVDANVNAMEFYVHHEDVRRAGTPEPPRDIEERDQRVLWAATARMGRVLARRAPVGIELVRSDAVGTVRISRGEPTVVVRGLPSELALYAYGRGAVAHVEVSGDEAAQAAVDDNQLGL